MPPSICSTGAVSAMMQVKPLVLTGDFVRLEPLAEEHRAGLARAADDTAIWTYLPGDGTGAAFDGWFDTSLEAQADPRQLVFAVRRLADDRLVGSTRYMRIEAEHHGLEIGFTWYAPEAWGGKMNPECKLLLLGHAFEALGAIRVELRTDARNTRSRRAIARLGAKEEGVLRHHKILPDGYLRDTVSFAILADEWPAARKSLEARLAGTA